jgi:hypothetical protein
LAVEGCQTRVASDAAKQYPPKNAFFTPSLAENPQKTPLHPRCRKSGLSVDIKDRGAPLFLELQTLFPHEPGTITLIVSLVATLIGVGLWLNGARYSRGILTLTAVALGAVIGMQLPHWRHWSIDPMAPAVGLSVILGFSAFSLHRVWVGFWLGLILAAWTSLALWGIFAPGESWQWPAWQGGQQLGQYLSDLWANMPAEMWKYFPYLVSAAILCGLSTAMIWPRAGTLLLWSAAGMSLTIVMGSLALTRLAPAMLHKAPGAFWSQLASVAGLVIIGALVQWRMMPGRKKPTPAEKAEAETQPH